MFSPFDAIDARRDVEEFLKKFMNSPSKRPGKFFQKNTESPLKCLKNFLMINNFHEKRFSY